MEKLIAKYFLLLLIMIAICAFAARTYHLSYPIADWHSWRQADTAAVARNFLRYGIDPLHPRYDDVSNIPSGKENPQGWRMVEFPLYQASAAWIASVFPAVPLETWLRLLTITASVGTVLLLGLIVRKLIDPFTGILTAFVFAVLPYSVFYGRTILPDPHMVFWAVLSLWLVSRGVHIWWTILAGIAAAISLLTKPTGVFLLIPVPFILLRRFGFSRHMLIRLAAFSLISVAPLVFWRKWILQFPEGIPVSAWLLNGNGIRFKGAWFHWLFARRLNELILGYWGLIPFGLGLAMAPIRREGWVFRWWVVGALLYLIIFATGNVQHDYYQILILPIVAVLTAKGLAMLFRNHISGSIVAIISMLAMVGFSWFTIRTYYWVNRPEIVEAGEAADRLLPENAKVIAPYNGDTAFLYQTRRQGWPVGSEIDKKISMGATAYVTVSTGDSDGETKDLVNRFRVLFRNDMYAIIDLTKPATPAASRAK